MLADEKYKDKSSEFSGTQFLGFVVIPNLIFLLYQLTNYMMRLQYTKGWVYVWLSWGWENSFGEIWRTFGFEEHIFLSLSICFFSYMSLNNSIVGSIQGWRKTASRLRLLYSYAAQSNKSLCLWCANDVEVPILPFFLPARSDVIAYRF